MAAKTWTGLGADNNWSTGGNWDGGTVPGASDVCSFNSTSTKNCTIDNVGAASPVTIQVAETYGGTITQDVSLNLTGSNILVNSGSAFVMNANITGGGSVALSDTTPAVGGTFTRTTGSVAQVINVGADCVLNLGTDASVGGIVTNSGSTVTGDGDIIFVTGTTNLVNGTNWDTSGVTSLLCQGSGTAAHALTIGTSESSLSGVPITVTGAGNFTFTGANYDFNVVGITKSGSGSVTVSAGATIDLGASPTSTINGMTINGTVKVSGTWNFIQLSTASPVAISVASGATVSGALTTLRLRSSLTINAAATWPSSVVLDIVPDVNTTVTITATAHTFGNCTLGGSTSVALTIASGTSITTAANQTAGFTGLVTVTGTLNLLGDITLAGALTTSASSTLSGTGIITCTDGAFTMNATCTVSNTVGVNMKFTSGTGRTFAGASKTYASLRRSGTGSGTLTITGTNTFTGSIRDDDGSVAHTIIFPNVTTTVGGFQVRGSAGKNVTLSRTGGAGTWTLTTTGGVDIRCNYLTISNSTVDASPVWYAGPQSTNSGGNTNWIFGDSPNGGRFRKQGIFFKVSA